MDAVKPERGAMPSIWSNQVRDSRSAVAKFRHGSYCSKAQMHLHKILYIIESVPSRETQIDGLGGDRKGLDFAGNENWLLRRNEGFRIDLNLRLGPFPDFGGAESSSSADDNNGCFSAAKAAETGSTAVSDGGALTVERSSEAECEPKEADGEGNGTRGLDSVPIVLESNRNGDESGAVDEKRTELESEITNLESPRAETGKNAKLVVREEESREAAEESVVREDKTRSFKGKAGNRDIGYLSLLIEAAKIVSGHFGESESESESDSRSKAIILGGKSGIREGSIAVTDDDQLLGKTVINEGSKGQKRKKMNWMEEYYGGFDDVSPVVRSKRGRSQVLPCRFRDSVLEPLKRLARPQRSTIVSAKRRTRK